MNFILIPLVFAGLYLVPGFLLSRLFRGSFRTSLLFWVLGSYIVVPLAYMLLGATNNVTLPAYCGFLAAFAAILWIVRRTVLKEPQERTNFDAVFAQAPLFTDPEDKGKQLNTTSDVLNGVSVLVLALFIVVLMLPRLGLWQGYLPVGDDKPRVGQVTSIALSPALPLHFRFPVANLSIYYYHMVQPGLLTRFTANTVHVNHSWFIHLFVTYLLFAWLTWQFTSVFARNSLEKFIMIFGLTFFSGLEFYIARIKNYTGPSLEWWADWLSPQTIIHTQISMPFTANFYVTQHVIAVYFTFLIYLLMTGSEKHKVTTLLLVALLISVIAGSSMFVFIAFFIAFGIYMVVQFFRAKQRQLLIKDVSIIAILTFLFSLGLFQLLLSSGKQSYFDFRLNSFFILPNVGFSKLVNIMLTIPSYLTVELSLLFPVLIIYMYLFWRNRWYARRELLLFLLLIPLLLIFFIRAKGDNNFSMRGTLPALFVLALFFGHSVGTMWQGLKKTTQRITLFSLSLSMLLLLSTPSALWEAYYRYTDQFVYKEAIFAKIDELLPLNAIVFADVPEHDYASTTDPNLLLPDHIVNLGHRFSFKPVKYFTITDIEYTSAADKTKYAHQQFSALSDIEPFLLREEGLTSDFSVYYLTKGSVPKPVVVKDGGYTLYKLSP